MKRATCPKCGYRHGVYITPAQRQIIRDFKSEYPWVRNDAIANLLQISSTRCSEIIRGDIEKRGL